MKTRRLKFANENIGFQYLTENQRWFPTVREELLRTMSADEIDSSPIYNVLDDGTLNSRDPVAWLIYLAPIRLADENPVIEKLSRALNFYDRGTLLAQLDAGNYGPLLSYSRVAGGLEVRWA